jgi:diacylglycerol kinase (ATP)
MKARLIVNPVAGEDAGATELKTMNERLRRGMGDLDIVMTVGAGDAERAGRQAVLDGYDHLFVAGGDGTLNEVMNGVAVAGALESVTFGILPLGTGNDFASALGLPSDDLEAVLRILLAGHTRTVDAGAMNGRCFINASAGGFIAEVSEAVTPDLKTRTGKLAYVIGGAQILLEHETVGATLRIRGEDLDASPRSAAVEVHLGMQMFAVCNTRTIGGGHQVAPLAHIDDGWLDLCLVEDVPTLEFIALLRRVSAGDHLSDARVRYYRGRMFELSFDRPIKVNTDGQVLEAERCEYRVLPSAVRFLAPPDQTGASA